MVLSSVDLELWFEHKIGATTGKYGELDQIEKYLDAANRAMVGVEDGGTEVTWPLKGPINNCPRVALFCITRDPKVLDRHRYEKRLYTGKTPFGLVWPPQGHLRWQDFWPSAQLALDAALRGEWGEFERTLTHQFLGYWRSLPGMWKPAIPGADWIELLPDPRDLREGQKCGFDDLWDDLRIMASKLGCTSIIGWLGYEQRIEFPAGVSPQIDQIYVRPVKDVATERNWDERLGAYVLRLLLRRRDDQGWGHFRSEAIFDDRWHARLRLHRVGAADQLEILVAIHEWERRRDNATRRAAIAEAFWAGLKIASDELGLEFRGLE